MRAINYIRVSTDEQAATGYSVPSQLAACRRYDEEQMFDVVAEFTEDFTGTVPLEERPQGAKVYEMLRNDEADVLVVFSMNRLVRPPEEGDEWDMPVLIRGLAKLGKVIHRVDKGPIGSDFASLLMAMLDAKSAGDYRRNQLEQVTRGMRTKAEKGRVVGTGHRTYGYRYADNTFVIHEGEAETVRMMYRMLIEGKTLRQTAIHLTGLMVPLPQKPESHRWHASTVQRIIMSTTYKGEWHWRSNGNTITVIVPAIIPPEVWQAAQDALRQHAAVSKRNSKAKYLLTGMVKCGCGRSMHVQNYARGGFYVCSSRTARFPSEERICLEPAISAKHLNHLAWQYVSSVLGENFESDLKAAQAAESKRQAPLIGEIETVKQLLAEVDREATQLARVVRKAKGIMLTKLEEEMERIEKRQAELTARLHSMESELAQKPLSDRQAEDLRAFRERVLRGIGKATEDDKRRYFEILHVKVLVKDHKAQVSCLIESISAQGAQLNIAGVRMYSEWL